MISKEEKKVFSTLIYSDLFDFPLNFDEIHTLLISNKKMSQKLISKVLEKNKGIGEKNGYYFLRGRDGIVNLRKQRTKESKLKIKKNLYVLKLIGLIPSILLIGISGSVAVGNAKKSDDVDLFVITRKNCLWISRFLIVSLLLILNKKRKVGDKISPNKICANMFLDESALLINKKNLFTAKEIVQLYPLVNKFQTYEKFLRKNIWINKYIANFNISKPKDVKITKTNFIISNLDNHFFTVQKKYMLKKLTNEKIGKHFAWFHPDDKSQKTMKKFRERVARIKTAREKKIPNKINARKATSYNAILTPGY